MLHTQDVIQRFTNFQQFLNKINGLGQTGSESANQSLRILSNAYEF